jgi:type IV pilus assembly protein PilM
MYKNLFLNKDTPLLAVDISLQSVTIAELIIKNKRYELANIGMLPLSKGALIDGLIENPSEVAKVIKKLIKIENFKSRYVVSSIPGDHCIVKKIKFLTKNKDSFDEELAQEVEQEVPFDLDDVRFDYQMVENVINGDVEKWESMGGRNVEVVMTAVQKEIIDNRFDTLVEAGLSPVIFDSDVFAAGRALSFCEDFKFLKSGACALFCLGDPSTYINILSNGSIAFDQENMAFGSCLTDWKVKFPKEKLKKNNKLGKYFTNKLYKSAAGDEEKNINNKVFSTQPDMGVVDKMLEEADETFESFSEHSNKRIECIFICGAGALTYGMKDLIKDHFNIPVEIFNPFSAINVNPEEFNLNTLNILSPQFSVVIGLAARRFDCI